MHVKNTIIIVRHGESDFNVRGIIQGQLDKSVLTPKGIEQAMSIGKILNDIKFDAIHSSPLKRAVDTASIIASTIGNNNAEISIDNRLLEIDFGPWTGQCRDKIREDNPKEYSIWRKRPYDLILQGKKPVKDLHCRIYSFAESFFNPRLKSQTTLIVGHKGTVSALVNILLKLPKSHHHFLQIDRGSVTIIQERQRGEDTVEYELFCANERPYVENSNPVDFKTEERTKSLGEVFLVRHGQTESNIDRKYQGGKDIDLSSIGIENMRALANSFKIQIPARIVSSPLLRAKSSASILASYFDIKSISERKDMHEFLYGVWEGMTEEDVQRYRTAEYNQWRASPTNTEIPQAEHINDAYNRCSEIWDSFVEDLKSWHGSILSVAHDVVNRLMICNALDLPASYVWRFKQTNASVTVIAVKDSNDGNLRMLNHSPYSISKRLSDEWL